MSKKDYVLIAGVLHDLSYSDVESAQQMRRTVVAELAIVLKQDNARFDAVRFLKACNCN